MKKLITVMCGLVLAASLYGGAVTNTAKWNVPWGDAWRARVEATLDSYETQINADLDAANIEVGSVASAFDGNAITNLAPANVADGTLPAGVRATATNLTGSVLQSQIAKNTGWTNSFITSFTFTGGTGEVVMTTTEFTDNGLITVRGSDTIVTNSY